MSDCDLIDLASISSIQGNGFVVLVNTEMSIEIITAVSSNIAEIGNFDYPKSFLGKSISECFSGTLGESMLNLMLQRKSDEDHVKQYIEIEFDSLRKNYLLSIPSTYFRNYVLLEIIPDSGLSHSGISVLNIQDSLCHYTQCLNTLSSHHTLEKMYKTVCSAVTSMVDYERAMVYQFQEDLSGKVVYEWINPSVKGKIEEYQDTYFPASDIPLPARQMFIRKNIRVIFDNEIDNVDVIGNRLSESMDLSTCILRSVHPVHQSYMKNMGVRSSMSIGLEVEGNLWGLLVFHSYSSAVSPSGHELELLKNLGGYVSSQIFRVEQENYELRKISLVFSMDKIFESDALGTYLEDNVDVILRVLKSDCLTITVEEDHTKTWGNSEFKLSDEESSQLSEEVKTSNKDWLLKAFNNPSRGVLCIAQAGFSIIFVRKSITSDKVWSGDPSHVKVMRPDGVPGPRGSFERYIQSNVDSLNKWNKFDRKLATYISSIIRLYKKSLNKQEGPNVIHALTGQVEYFTEQKPEPILDSAIVSHFSHEIKTPLHGISSVLTLLIEDPDMSQAETQEQILYAQDSLKAVTRLVDSILNIASGKSISDSRPTKVNLFEFVENIEKKYSDKNLIVRIVGEKEEARSQNILLNRDVLHDSLCSIIESAISSYETKDVKMSVSKNCTHREAIMMWNDSTEGFSHRSIRNSEETSGLSDKDNWYTFSVQYYGIGIHEDMLTNVMNFGKSNAMQQIKNSHQGISADIYNCMNRIFGINGSIGIASTIGKCTRISIIVPAPSVEDELPNVQLEENDGIFIVVDDNIVNRRLACRLVKIAFKKHGLCPRILDFENGRICIEEIKKLRLGDENILGILLDHHMPVMTGKEAAKMIRGDEMRNHLPKIPILGFTADSDADMRNDLLSSGMDDVLPKPISMNLLENTCLRIMKQREF